MDAHTWLKLTFCQIIKECGSSVNGTEIRENVSQLIFKMELNKCNMVKTVKPFRKLPQCLMHIIIVIIQNTEFC